MEKIDRIKAFLEGIRSEQGDTFEYDEKGIVEDLEAQTSNQASLAIKVLSVLGGFLATLAFVGFLGIAGIFDSETSLTFLGVAFIIAAIWINRIFDKLIIDTFSVSIYIVGFTMLSVGLAMSDVHEDTIILVVGLIGLSALFFTQNYILSFISILVINGSWLTLILSNDVYDLVHKYIIIHTLLLTYFFLNEAKLISLNKKVSKLYNPIRIGLIVSLLFGLVAVGKRQLIPVSEDFIWISSVVLFAVIMYLAGIIMKINAIKNNKNKAIIYLLTALLLIPIGLSPAILGAILIMLLSFRVNYRTGLAIGIIALVYFVGQYYYDLNFTLLTKSILLFSSGIFFLGLYWFIHDKTKSNEKV
nr:DUF4401 domain-containing protein [Allomuricauda sp.]